MAVQFIVGRAGAGKSHYLYEKLIEKSLKYRNKNFIAIVPEQFSMETQKQILTMHPNRGSFNIEVTSMTRLAYTVFEEQGFNEYKVMDDLGKTLIMRKVMEQCKDKLTIYKSKTSMPGFAEKMKTIVSEFKQYGITDDVLNDMKAECDSKPLLRHKLNDVEIISDAFNEYIKEKVITTEDVLTIFCKYISSSDFIKNTFPRCLDPRIRNGILNTMVRILSEMPLRLFTMMPIPITPPSRIVQGTRNSSIANAAMTAPIVIITKSIIILKSFFFSFFKKHAPFSIIVPVTLCSYSTTQIYVKQESR